MTRKIRSKFQQKTALNLLNGVRSLYDRKLLTDMTLVCEGKEYAVHKMVLAADSSYFRDYFTQKENASSTTMLVDFTTSKILQIILDYFYTGRIIIKEEDILRSVIEVSSALQTPLLLNYCLGLLLKKPSTDLSLSDWKAIEELDSKIIFNIFLQNIIKKLAFWNTTKHFIMLSVIQINLLFHCPTVAESDQNIVFQSILNWIKYDPNGRKEHVTYLLENFVDFERLEPTLLSQVGNEQVLVENMYFLRSHFKLISIQSNPKIKKISEEKASQKHHIEKPQSLQKKLSKNLCLNVTNANSMQTDTGFIKPLLKRRFFIFSYDDVDKESRIQMYDYTENEFVPIIAHPLQNKKEATIVYHEGSIYSFGGQHFDGCRYNTTFSYNMKSNKWMERKQMFYYKCRSAAVVLHGFLYVLGGKDSENCRKFVERYNPVTDEWLAVADLPDINQETIPVLAINNCLYTLLNTKLYKYIPEDDEWHLVDIELSKFFNSKKVCMAKGNNRIFIIEKKQPKAVWIYDPEENSVSEDIIPAVLTECEGILNLENPEYLVFLVSGNMKWFIYRPPHLWNPFDPKRLEDYYMSDLTVIPY